MWDLKDAIKAGHSLTRTSTQTTIEVPGQVPMVNGVAIPGSVVNPNCTSPGGITCYYWAGSVKTVNGPTGPGRTECGTCLRLLVLLPWAVRMLLLISRHTQQIAIFRGGKSSLKGPCYNNPNWGNTITGNITDGNSFLQCVASRAAAPRIAGSIRAV